jgi:hypothetical protein
MSAGAPMLFAATKPLQQGTDSAVLVFFAANKPLQQDSAVLIVSVTSTGGRGRTTSTRQPAKGVILVSSLFKMPGYHESHPAARGRIPPTPPSPLDSGYVLTR